jgi:methylglutaconyl-CoA hydratase
MLSNLPIPTLAEVKGRVIGGGLGFVAAVDIAIATDSFHGKFSESLLGLVPATIAPYIVRAIGDRATRALFLTANSINAKKAVEFGLLHEVVSTDQLSNRCDEILNAICACAPKSQMAIKEQLSFLREELQKKPFIHIQQDSISRLAKVRVSDEAVEGLNAFIEKRDPVWRKKTDQIKA